MGERARMLTLSTYKLSFSKETLKLPGTFDEFLTCFNLDDWPKTPYLPDVNPYPLVSRIKNDYPVDTVAQYLYDNAPMPYEIISRLEKRIDECKLQVQEHAKHIFTLESEKSEKDKQTGQDEVTSSPESQDTSKKKIKIEVKFPTEAPKDASNKDFENAGFSGFNLWKLTKLPNNLEPAHLWDLVLKVRNFKDMNTQVLKKLFFSEASLAILQDSFWWWFLHKFQPDQDEQDHFFDRISDSYVALLWSIPNYIKDAFLQMYPDCLSQAIYITFCEAFPQSCHRFNDQFKDELMDLIFLWIRVWECLQEFLEHRMGIPEGILRFQVTNEEQPAHTKKESHYAGDGPDFQHSLFNLGGQSPLVSYYFQMHGLPNTLANSRGYRINHSEICKVPTPLSPTYMDVIHKSIKTSRKLQNNFSDFEHKCYAELVMLQEKRERADRKFRRMLGTITTKPTEKRMKIEQFLLQMANAKIQRHGSCGSESGTKEV